MLKNKIVLKACGAAENIFYSKDANDSVTVLKVSLRLLEQSFLHFLFSQKQN